MGKPGVLQSMGLQRVGHELATEKEQLQSGYNLSSVLCYHTAFFVNFTL